jgi:hypothetical protein
MGLLMIAVLAWAYGTVLKDPLWSDGSAEAIRILLRVQIVTLFIWVVVAILEGLEGLTEDLLTKSLLYLGATLLAGALVCLLYGVVLGEQAVVDSATRLTRMLLLFVPVAILALVILSVWEKLVNTIDEDGPPRFERNWGSLGNGSQGWRISRSLTYLAVFLCAVGMMGLSVQVLADFGREKPGESEPRGEQKAGTKKSDSTKQGETKQEETKKPEPKGGEAKSEEVTKEGPKKGEAKKDEVKEDEAKKGEAKKGETK